MKIRNIFFRIQHIYYCHFNGCYHQKQQFSLEHNCLSKDFEFEYLSESDEISSKSGDDSNMIENKISIEFEDKCNSTSDDSGDET